MDEFRGLAGGLHAASLLLVDPQRRATLMTLAVLISLIFLAAVTGWPNTTLGLASYIVVGLVVSGVGLVVALRAGRKSPR